MVIYRLLLLVCISGYWLYGAADRADRSDSSAGSEDHAGSAAAEGIDDIANGAGLRAVTPTRSGAGGPSSAFARSPGRGAIGVDNDKGDTTKDRELESLVPGGIAIDPRSSRPFPSVPSDASVKPPHTPRSSPEGSLDGVRAETPSESASRAASRMRSFLRSPFSPSPSPSEAVEGRASLGRLSASIESPETESFSSADLMNWLVHHILRATTHGDARSLGFLGSLMPLCNLLFVEDDGFVSIRNPKVTGPREESYDFSAALTWLSARTIREIKAEIGSAKSSFVEQNSDLLGLINSFLKQSRETAAQPLNYIALALVAFYKILAEEKSDEEASSLSSDGEEAVARSAEYDDLRFSLLMSGEERERLHDYIMQLFRGLFEDEALSIDHLPELVERGSNLLSAIVSNRARILYSEETGERSAFNQATNHYLTKMHARITFGLIGRLFQALGSADLDREEKTERIAAIQTAAKASLGQFVIADDAPFKFFHAGAEPLWHLYQESSDRLHRESAAASGGGAQQHAVFVDTHHIMHPTVNLTLRRVERSRGASRIDFGEPNIGGGHILTEVLSSALGRRDRVLHILDNDAAATPLGFSATISNVTTENLCRLTGIQVLRFDAHITDERDDIRSKPTERKALVFNESITPVIIPLVCKLTRLAVLTEEEAREHNERVTLRIPERYKAAGESTGEQAAAASSSAGGGGRISDAPRTDDAAAARAVESTVPSTPLWFEAIRIIQREATAEAGMDDHVRLAVDFLHPVTDENAVTATRLIVVCKNDEGRLLPVKVINFFPLYLLVSRNTTEHAELTSARSSVVEGKFQLKPFKGRAKNFFEAFRDTSRSLGHPKEVDTGREYLEAFSYSLARIRPVHSDFDTIMGTLVPAPDEARSVRGKKD